MVYELPNVTTTLRITLIGANSLFIHTRVDAREGRQDYDDYFYRDGSRVLPDLVVSGLSIPKPVVVYGAVPRTEVTMTIKKSGREFCRPGRTRQDCRAKRGTGSRLSAAAIFRS